MSVVVVEREVTVTRPVRVFECDGPGCPVSGELPQTLKVMAVPPGWFMVLHNPADGGVNGTIPDSHYHGVPCLLRGYSASGWQARQGEGDS